MREELITLLSANPCPNAICNFCEHFKNTVACEKHRKEVIADYLITNGVTIVPNGNWITALDDMGWAKHTCFNCGYIKRTDIHVRLGWGYCPKCGAQMHKQ